MAPLPPSAEYDKLRAKLGAARIGDYNTPQLTYRATIPDPEKTGHGFPPNMLSESFTRGTCLVFCNVNISIMPAPPNELYHANGSLKEQYARTAEHSPAFLQVAWDVRRYPLVCFCVSIQDLECSL